MSAENCTRREGRRALLAMKTFRVFLRLPAATQVLALEAAFVLLLARLLVGQVPMRYWRHRLDTAPVPSPGPEGRGAPRWPAGGDRRRLPGESECPGRQDENRGALPPEARVPRRVGRIVGKVARRLPFRALCLPQAMAAQWMLRRRGVRSQLVFGARRGTAPDRALEFHAWLIVAGECVIGAGEVETYTPLRPHGTAVRCVNQDEPAASTRV